MYEAYPRMLQKPFFFFRFGLCNVQYVKQDYEETDSILEPVELQKVP